MATPKQFAKNLGKIAVEIEGNVEKGVRKTVLAIDNAVVNLTPVDTGRAKANWFANVDAPSAKVTESTNAQAAKTQVGFEVSKFDLGKNTSIHLTNNLPYIEALNNGSSKQRAAGFVRGAVLAGITAVKSVKLLKK